MRQVIERSSFRSHDDVGKECIFGMHVCTAFNCRNHRHANVREILQDLNAFVVDLTPNCGIANVAKRRKVDRWNEFSTRARQDHDLVFPVLRDSIKGLDKVRMVRCGEVQRTAVAVEGSYQDSACVSLEFQATIGGEVSEFILRHGGPLYNWLNIFYAPLESNVHIRRYSPGLWTNRGGNVPFPSAFIS